MESKALQDIFIRILSDELRGTETDEAVKTALASDPDAVTALYVLSKEHDLAHMLAPALTRAGATISPEIKAELQKEEFLSIYRMEQMKYAYAQITQALECASVDYIPLKGAVIRPYYPKESMRTSCDIDILVREESLAAAIGALQVAGFTGGERNYHDVSLVSPEGIHLELHFSICENNDRLDRVLLTAWDHAHPVKGHCFAFTEAFFVFHMYAHMGYHFLSGGCGVRSLLDLWVVKHRMNVEPSVAHDLLARADLCEFAAEMERLVDICFAGAQADDFSAFLLDYIVMGGVYGSQENGVAMQSAKSGGRLRYIMKRIFPPYADMKYRYPTLCKAPILLPICWIVRLIGKLRRRKGKQALAEWKIADHTTADHIKAAKTLQDRLHL